MVSKIAYKIIVLEEKKYFYPIIIFLNSCPPFFVTKYLAIIAICGPPYEMSPESRLLVLLNSGLPGRSTIMLQITIEFTLEANKSKYILYTWASLALKRRIACHLRLL